MSSDARRLPGTTDKFCPACGMIWLTAGVCTGGPVGNRYPKHAPIQVVNTPADDVLWPKVQAYSRSLFTARCL